MIDTRQLVLPAPLPAYATSTTTFINHLTSLSFNITYIHHTSYMIQYIQYMIDDTYYY